MHKKEAPMINTVRLVPKVVLVVAALVALMVVASAVSKISSQASLVVAVGCVIPMHLDKVMTYNIGLI